MNIVLHPAPARVSLAFLAAALAHLATGGCTNPVDNPKPVIQPASSAAQTEPAPIDAPQATDNPDAYFLPFPAGMTSPVGQGAFGVGGLGSHVGEYAIDFVMPERTAVLAARAGKVVDVRQSCPNVNCPFDPDRCCGNYVKLRHADGTTAAYWHLVQYGSCVQVGDTVARGDIIGKSGNTGMSLTPHLHFAVSAARGQTGTGSLGYSRDNSMEVQFADVPGDGIPVFLGIYTSRNQPAVDHCD